MTAGRAANGQASQQPPSRAGQAPGAWGQPEARPASHASGGSPSSEPEQSSAADLVKQLTEQTKTLVQQELRLAQLEMKEKGKRLGLGAGLFGGAGMAALYGVGALLTTIVLLLATFLEPWIAGSILAVTLLAAAGALGLTGKKQVEQATPPAPEEAIDSVKGDVQTVKARARG